MDSVKMNILVDVMVDLPDSKFNSIALFLINNRLATFNEIYGGLIGYSEVKDFNYSIVEHANLLESSKTIDEQVAMYMSQIAVLEKLKEERSEDVSVHI